MQFYQRYKEINDFNILSMILFDFLVEVKPNTFTKDYCKEIARKFLIKYEKLEEKLQKLSKIFTKAGKSLFLQKLRYNTTNISK